MIAKYPDAKFYRYDTDTALGALQPVGGLFQQED